jgi:hypothetical protein
MLLPLLEVVAVVHTVNPLIIAVGVVAVAVVAVLLIRQQISQKLAGPVIRLL